MKRSIPTYALVVFLPFAVIAADVAGPAAAAKDPAAPTSESANKPVELKFTAADGQLVDLANMRGKVVLVDFWASWCGPCIAEMPNVVSTYQKLHEKGFEVLGISLDSEKGEMESALKKQNMKWPQYFEASGENRIAAAFRIEVIPSSLLIDKKGILRETGLRGEALGKAVEKLLGE